MMERTLMTAHTSKQKVWTAYTEFHTWDVVDENMQYITHGSIQEIEEWLLAHKDTHEDMGNC